MAPGETTLNRLLAGLHPKRHPGTYVFCALPPEKPMPAGAVMWFREAEGVALILEQEQAAQHGLAAFFPCVWITLEVPSSLEAVGLTAAVSTRLAAEGIACNVVAALHHDHLFVPVAQAEQAWQTLLQLQQEAAHADTTA